MNCLFRTIYFKSLWGLGQARTDCPRLTWSSFSSTLTMMRRQSKGWTLWTFDIDMEWKYAFICIFLSTPLNLKSAMHNLNQSNINIFLRKKSQSFPQNGTGGLCLIVLMENSTHKASWKYIQSASLRAMLQNSVIMFLGFQQNLKLCRVPNNCTTYRTFDTDKNGSIDFKEFLLAIDVTSNGCPEEKLNWAFR